MKYEVVYLSKSGNTAALAQAIADMLPTESTRITDLAQSEASGGADVNFIGFEVNSETIPLKIMDALDYAEGRIVILFGTCSVIPTQDHKAIIERKIQPFLPDDCDYRGIFLCAGQLPEHAAELIKNQHQMQPDNPELNSYLKNHYETIGHPDAQDIENLQRFIQNILVL